jgi:hypothetical protein
MRALATLILLFPIIGASACGSPVDTDGLDPIDDYTTWERRVDAVGPVGGHGDSYRIMYANERAEEFTGAGGYPRGSVIVKEIRAIDSGETPGDIRYLAIMRKLGEAPPGGELFNSWMFTRANDIDSEETSNARCFKTCHQAAPLDGTFLDWSFDRR